MMDRRTMDYLKRRMSGDGARRRDRDYDEEHPKHSRERRYHHDDEDEYEHEDYRKSSRGMRRRDYREDYDHEHSSLELSKHDMHRWKHMLVNADGTEGAHYEMHQIIPVAEKLKIKFDEFDEKEFCMAVNMMYSDYCTVAKKYIAPDKELSFFAELAKHFLEDEDGPEAPEKLALYFHCIVDCSEV